MSSISSYASTVASSLATLSTPQTFTGVSSYSSDLQSILSRSQQIAQIPVKILQNDQTTLQNEISALTSMQSSVGAVATALTRLADLNAQGALSGTTSNSNVTVAVDGTGASPGTYVISDVTSLASYSTATMTNPVADPSATAVAPTDTNTLYLVTGGAPVQIQLTADTNNLYGLRDAINSANAGVAASIITTSDGSYLALTATTAGPAQIQLLSDPNDTGTDLLSMNQTGSLAAFSINGKPTTATTNQVSGIINGATINLNGIPTTGTSVTLTVSANAAPISSALQTLVSAYNNLGTSVQAQVGASGGALVGNQIVRSIQEQMHQVAYYQGSGAVQSLMDLGVTLNRDGTMSFDSSRLNGMSSQQLAAALSFIGDGSTGLSALGGNFSLFSDSTTGVIQQTISQDQRSQQRLQDQIDAMNVRIAAAQKAEMTKLQAADAALAALESQQSTLTATIKSLNSVLYGTNTSSGSTSS
jgi:flagellar hook-associated protein 2